MKLVIALLVYLVGMLFTHRMIVASNIPDTPQEPAFLKGLSNPPNLSPLWAFIWPVFWLRTIPIFYKLRCKEKDMSPQGAKAEEQEVQDACRRRSAG